MNATNYRPHIEALVLALQQGGMPRAVVDTGFMSDAERAQFHLLCERFGVMTEEQIVTLRTGGKS